MFCESYSDLYYWIFSPEAPALLYYSHIPTLVVSLFISLFILIKTHKKLPSITLAATSLLFSVWTILDLLLWTQVDSRLLMFLWSFWFTIFSGIFIFSLYFVYTFIFNRDVKNIWKVMGFLVLVFPMLMSFTQYNLEYFDVFSCNAAEGSVMVNYAYTLSIIVFIGVFLMGFINYFKTKDLNVKNQILYVSIGVLLFLLSFGITTYYASLLNWFNSRPDTFAAEQYGFIGMAVFMFFLAFSVVRYNTFNIKMLATQALVLALVASLFSQLLVTNFIVGKAINVITLLITIFVGYFLIKSVKKVDEQREALDLANKQQTNLLHFISHQVKGFFTKSRNAFSGLLEGDYGPIPDTARHIIQEGFDSDNRGVQTVQEILSAANLKTGQTTYVMNDTNLINVIKDILLLLKPASDKKSLTVNFNPGVTNLMMKLDTAQITQALKNLIDNSIKYTPSGKIDITLETNNEKKEVIIKVSDTGVGISAEDMPKLFSEGGRGKDSIKVNVDSTGYGLYIVKNIIEAHGGSVTAYSGGEGKGSVFTVVLPVR